ncbi:MAG TPA: phenylalanine--tRNA ligase subunit alpha, partial [Candidatus Baltobacteraceae bacterium]|nr:phenylalanine--tRNA ligase subunit alpha [Candidatus Baltobacteraceae bacterium]
MGQLGLELEALAARLKEALAQVDGSAALEALRVQFLGRNGEITAVRRTIGALPATERPEAGKTINEGVAALEALLEEKLSALKQRELIDRLSADIDVTFPGMPPRTGSIHPVRRTLEDACAYFERRGFAVVLGNEIETEYYNFDALNIPPDHPARESLDSFYLRPGLLLRTHTSPM